MNGINEIKNKASEVKSLIDNSGRILMVCHPHPDPDSVGTGLALYEYLTSIGKKVDFISGDSKLAPFLKQLPLSENIIEKNATEVNFSDYDLFLVHDISSIQMISGKQGFVFPKDMNTLIIDHHDSNPAFAKYNLICKDFPATAEIVYFLFKEWGVDITKTMALNLMCGIWFDTGGFQYASTNTLTFEVATELSKIVPDYTNILGKVLNSLEKADVKLVGMCLGSLKEYAGGKFAICLVTREDLDKNGIKNENISSRMVINLIRSVADWNVAAVMFEEYENTMKCSFRSNDPNKYDLTKLVKEFNGGGHKMAAGAVIKMKPEDARDALVQVYEKVYMN